MCGDVLRYPDGLTTRFTFLELLDALLSRVLLALRIPL